MKFFLLLLSFAFLSCDPGHFGKTIVRNESAYALELKYTTHLKDTTIIIEPNSYKEVFEFGGLGMAREYSCCVCEFQAITLMPADTSLNITKPITNPGNWSMDNSNTKRFSFHEIGCEFVVGAGDIE